MQSADPKGRRPSKGRPSNVPTTLPRMNSRLGRNRERCKRELLTPIRRREQARPTSVYAIHRLRVPGTTPPRIERRSLRGRLLHARPLLTESAINRPISSARRARWRRD